MHPNNSFLLESLCRPPTQLGPKPRKRVASAVVFPSFLPPLSILERLGSQRARQARHDEILAHSLATALETPLDASPAAPPLKEHGRARPSLESVADTRGKASSSNGPNADGKFEAFHVLRAIEKKDLMLLMEIRSRQFELLVQSLPGTHATPLLHAMRLGPSHREVAIVLTGAISKKVNDLTDEDLAAISPPLRSLLRAIRANLKIAIQYGLESSQTDLVASYLQVIIMSEGDKLVQSMTQKVALALRSGKPGKPVDTAEKLLDKWISRELKRGEIASVNEYLNNAAGDLVLMGLWNMATDKVVGESIPTYFFARDDRITKALEDRLAQLRKLGAYGKLARQLRMQLDASLEIMGRRNVNYRVKVEMLKKALDED